MADNAKATIGASVFFDSIKSQMNGSQKWTKGTSDKWVYQKRDITYASGTGDLVVDSSVDFLGDTNAVAGGDLIRWIAIKNLATDSTHGICLGLGSTAAYNLTTGIFLGAGEVLVFKPINCTTDDLQVIAVKLDSDGIPISGMSSNVSIEYAALLKDV